MADPRTAWIADATATLSQHSFVSGVWLVGSLASGTADAYSDIDLITAVDTDVPGHVMVEPFTALGLPGTVLFTRPKPRNAPADGSYLAICLDLAGLPVLVDLYVWPSATAAVPPGGRILYARSHLPATDLEFLALLDRHRTTDTAGADPHHPATVLLLVQLAAKYHARGDDARQRGIHQQLEIAEDASTAALHTILDNRVSLDSWPQFAPAVEATRRLLHHAGVRPPSAPG